jgi:hypothetical protein
VGEEVLSGGGSELMRKCHDSGGTLIKNHQIRPPPPLLIKGRMFRGGEGSIWILHHRFERTDLSCLDLCTPSTMRLGTKLRINDKSGFLSPYLSFFLHGDIF